MKKNLFMFTIGFILLTFFMYCCKTNFDLYRIATDSGFDTSYGGSSSGSSSSSSSSWGGSSSGSGGGSSIEIDETTIEGNLTLAIIFGVFMLIIPLAIDHTKYKIWTILAYGALGVCVVLKIVLPVMFISMWLIPIVIVGGIIISSRKEKKRRDFNLKRKYLPKTAENIKLLEEAYEIFIETQIAWMSFDYDKLREVTTDELYNTYYNQLQPLKLKEQINVMHDFELVRYEVVEKINGTSGTTVKVELEVKFYDYISNSKGACIRGNQDRKVHMLYDLTYVYKEEAIKECPNCNAPLHNVETICNYCNTKITSVRSKMKLATKKCLSQK